MAASFFTISSTLTISPLYWSRFNTVISKSKDTCRDYGANLHQICSSWQLEEKSWSEVWSELIVSTDYLVMWGCDAAIDLQAYMSSLDSIICWYLHFDFHLHCSSLWWNQMPVVDDLGLIWLVLHLSGRFLLSKWIENVCLLICPQDYTCVHLLCLYQRQNRCCKYLLTFLSAWQALEM